MSNTKKRPTLQDIADQVGVTKMTVSRYLRDSKQVSQEIGKKIAIAVDELGYVQNRAPDLLSRAKSRAIGILVPSLTNQVFDEMISGIESVTEPRGYQSMLAHYGYSPEQEQARIETLLSYNVDGIILSESYHTERAKKILLANNIPTIEVMDSVTPPIHQAVGFDNQKASRVMTERLISNGRKNIVYLGAGGDTRTRLRIDGYRQAVEKAGLPFLPVADAVNSSFTGGAEFLHRALETYPNIDAVICTNDDLAVGAMFECQRMGIKVPEQIAVAGFHGLNVSQAVSPRLASVVTPREEMGRIAAAALLDRIDNPQVEFQRVIELDFDIEAGESI